MVEGTQISDYDSEQDLDVQYVVYMHVFLMCYITSDVRIGYY